MDLCGTLTAELFLLADGSLVVNELAPRVHNSGHWTIEGAATSQFEQHIRAICGLGLGSPAALSPTAMVNLLGAGPRRPARLPASRRPSPTRPSTSTCTTSGASSSVARWDTSPRSAASVDEALERAGRAGGAALGGRAIVATGEEETT